MSARYNARSKARGSSPTDGLSLPGVKLTGKPRLFHLPNSVGLGPGSKTCLFRNSVSPRKSPTAIDPRWRTVVENKGADSRGFLNGFKARGEPNPASAGGDSQPKRRQRLPEGRSAATVKRSPLRDRRGTWKSLKKSATCLP